jgi:hypothetical protein
MLIVYRVCVPVAIPHEELPRDRFRVRLVGAVRDKENPMTPQELCERYVSAWNEPDADVRRQRVAELWSEGGYQVLAPPQDIRASASTLGMTATLEAHGHDALQARVTRAYEEFVAGGGYIFRPHGDAERLRDVVKFRWEMVPAAGGEIAGVGLEILLLDQDERIRADYQFIET